jgi:NADPH:quinone reductase-like Zn-dependent oxidoreductase
MPARRSWCGARAAVSAPFFPLIAKQLTLDGTQVGNRNGLDALVRAVDRIKLRTVIDSEYAFGDLPAALDHLARGPFGKIVVRVPD